MIAAWDVFIAYPSPESSAADGLYTALCDGGARVFLDRRCLRPGDLWTAELAAAQRSARLTAVLISARSARAWFETDEILRAIDLGRQEHAQHRVVPVYLDDDVDTPYGLRIFHALSATASRGLDVVAHELLDVLGLPDVQTSARASRAGELRPRAAPARRSPFRPGTPLYAGDLLPGDSRRALVQTIAADLANGTNVNLIGERRLGRTSTLNHVWARLIGDPGYVVARVNMQDNVVDSGRFYGAVIRGVSRSATGAGLLARDLIARVQQDACLTYDDLRGALESLREHATVVVLVDEFERCFDLLDGFAIPVFYDNLRSLLGGDERGPLAVAAIATREPLSVYFDRRQITSTLPSYLPPRYLEALTDADVEDTLIQDSPHVLGPAQRNHAAALAARHPCRLQCAAEACYRALDGGHDRIWVVREFERLSRQLCGDAGDHHRARAAGGADSQASGGE